jgi:hypothetical protein
LDFSRTNVPGKLISAFEVGGPAGDKHYYTVEAFVAPPRLIFLQRASAGTEPPVVHVYPFATERFRTVIAGVALLQSWDSEHLSSPVLMRATPIELGEGIAEGTLPEGAYSILDKIWEGQAKQLGLCAMRRES